MRFVRSAKIRVPVSVAAAGAMTLMLAAADASAIEVQCGAAADGDSFGWAVASGGDWDGDGNADIAVGAPCAWVGTNEKAGRVRIFSGATGQLLASLSGSNSKERYGSALAFLPDINGDGRAELAIGASTFDAPTDAGSTRTGAGRVEVRSSAQGGTVLWEVRGTNAFANLGETVAALPDLNHDGKADLAVGASLALVSGSRDGVAYVLSGANGEQIAHNDAIYNAENWGSLVGAAGDVDGDGTPDWLVSSNFASLPPGAAVTQAVSASSTTTTTTTTTTSTLLDRAGRFAVISGKEPFDLLTELFGHEPGQRFGRSAVATSDGNGDQRGDLWIGSPGSTVTNLPEAGVIELWSGLGSFIRRIKEPDAQSLAGFGTSLAAPGSLDGGAGNDVVAGAPFAKIAGAVEAGRVRAFDGTTGTPLWVQTGSLASSRFGTSLSTGFDFNGDQVPDLVVGSPGATPNGRRGAGAAYVLSGKNGKVLASFAGRRGRETRLFIAGPDFDRHGVVRSFDPFGHRREADIRAFRAQPAKSLSMALLDPAGRASAGKAMLAVGAGKGGASPTIAVYRAGRRRLRVTAPFAAGQAGYVGGLNVAAGDFTAAKPGDEFAVAPADDVTGTADVVIWQRFANDGDPFGRFSWTKVREFAAFAPTDKIEGFTVGAVGVNIAGGPLTSANDLDEIVVAPAAGLPAVKVLSNTGVPVSQWLAYPLDGPNVGTNSGTSIALGDLKGDGNLEIITAPARGQLWVRAWNSAGDPYKLTKDSPEVSFFVTQFGPVFEGGLTLTTADVDFDGADEIIVAPGAGIPGQILAFEADGKPVTGWTTFQPYGPLAMQGLTLLGMNDFWRP